MGDKAKILTKENIHKSKYFQLDKVTIDRNGKKFVKDIISRTPTIIILPLNQNGEIYLVSQYRDSMQEVLLETVAGHMEGGETPLEAAKKELQEETGVIAKIWKQISTFYVSADMNAIVHIFYATDLTEGVQNLDEDEDIEIVKIPFAEALERIETGEIRVSSNIAALYLLDKLKKGGEI